MEDRSLDEELALVVEEFRVAGHFANLALLGKYDSATSEISRWK